MRILVSKPVDETKRLEELHSLRILDTLPEKEYDEITKIAAQICQTPISLITLIDEHRQWFKSKYGLQTSQTSRADSFCAHSIKQPDQPLIVKNAHEDPRFRENPLVLGDPDIDFYAGIPLVTKNGATLGSLCVIDHEPRELSHEQLDALKSLARHVVKLLELRRTVIELTETKEKLEKSIQHKEEINHIIAHDLKAPVRNIEQFAKIILDEFSDDLKGESKDFMERIMSSAHQSQRLISGVLQYSKETISLSYEKSQVDLNELLGEIISLINPPANISINCDESLPTIHTSRIALQTILYNLISNSVKYNDKASGQVDLGVEVKDNHAHFKIKDNGRGIPERELNKIFSIFYMVDQREAKQKNSSGVGLTIVKKVVENLGGKISVNSKEGEGTCFEFDIEL